MNDVKRWQWGPTGMSRSAVGRWVRAENYDHLFGVYLQVAVQLAEATGKDYKSILAEHNAKRNVEGETT